jgi:Flp pilus assembly protein TadD
MRKSRSSGGQNDKRREPSHGKRAAGSVSKRNLAIIALGLAIATSVVYARVGQFGFTDFDDPAYVTENSHILTGITGDNLAWAFRADAVTGNWHPLTWLSLMLDASLFRKWAGGYHLVNVGLHVGNTLLLFAFLAVTTGLIWRAGFVAALFALHPLHVESVAWISERKDVLSTLFLMLTLLAYARYARKPDLKRYAAVLVGFAAGLMSKPMLVSAPFLLLLLDWWPLQRVRGIAEDRSPFPRFAVKRLLLEKLPLAVLAAASGIITIGAQGAGGTVTSSAVIPFAGRVENAIMSYGLYIAKTLLPTGLACYYPHPSFWPWWQPALVMTALVVATGWVLVHARALPYVVVGWAWYLVSLVPVIGLVQVGLQARADRYSYIPLIGIFIVASYGIPPLLLDRGKRNSIRVGMAASCGAVLLMALGAASSGQASTWKDSVSLYSRALAATHENWFAHNGMGVMLRRDAERLDDSGDTRAAADKYREAMPHFQETIRLLPQYADAHNSLAVCLSALGSHDEALAELVKAISLEPRHAQAQNNLGNELLRRGQAADAIGHYREAIHIDPDSAGTHYNLGMALTAQKQLAEAEAEYRRVLSLSPDPYFAYWARNKLAVLLEVTGRHAEAISVLEEAVRIHDTHGIDKTSDAARKNLNLFRQKQF